MQGSSDSLAIRDSSVCRVAASETIATLEERASSDQRTNHAEPLCFQGVRFEDLYRFSLSNDNIAPTCGELCWVLASVI